MFFWHQKFPPVFLPSSYARRQASTPVGMWDPPFALSFGIVMVPLLLNGFVANGL